MMLMELHHLMQMKITLQSYLLEAPDDFNLRILTAGGATVDVCYVQEISG